MDKNGRASRIGFKILPLKGSGTAGVSEGPRIETFLLQCDYNVFHRCISNATRLFTNSCTKQRIG